jgi:GT2 family glycosyltransferase
MELFIKSKTEIDIIILSFAKNEKLKSITEQCISSLIASENKEEIKFNVVVIESQKEMEPFQYPNTKTIYPEEGFGYHRYMNIGIEMTFSKYVCLCNNDLRFHKGWASEILKAFHKYYDLSSASPFCSLHHPKMGFEENNGLYTGYRSRYEVAGWCLFLKRDVLRLTGKLDENYQFWCADNDYANTLAALKLRHALVSSSVVDHLDSCTLDSQAEETAIASSEFFYLEKKWNHRTMAGWTCV